MLWKQRYQRSFLVVVVFFKISKRTPFKGSSLTLPPTPYPPSTFLPPSLKHHRVNQTDKQFLAPALTLRPQILFQLPGLLLSQ